MNNETPGKNSGGKPVSSPFCRSAGEVADKLQAEGEIRHKTDANGHRWFKVYFGSGAHYRNWLEQAEEVFGRDNIQTEEVPFPGLKCFAEDEETAFRIWVREDR